MSSEVGHESASVAERIERRWATISVIIVVFMAGLAGFVGIHKSTMPQARVEIANPATLHVSGEFVENNLGSAVEPDGSVTVRMIGQQYSFTPQCVLVPTDTPITIRATSADAIHGFLVEGTNINTMLIPGYVSTITARFSTPADHTMPCHEFCGLGHQSMWARVKVIPKAEFLTMSEKQGGWIVLSSKRLILAHFWLAFALFGLALALGAWQMLIRSPLLDWIGNPEWYYRSVTAHGTVMAYVFPTLVAMGFGYAISESALGQPLVGRRWAWLGFVLVLVGAVTAMIPVSLGLASVLYTFYPPLIGNPFYYIGIVVAVVGSWIWVALMSINLAVWKRANPGKPVPLAMFANVAGSYLWGWTALGAAMELLFQIIPVALGLSSSIDAGLSRVLFSWSLHAIVYFWLMPTYIAYYTIVPRAIGGKLYSDAMGRIAFILFLVVAMPIGIHHTFADPQVGAGFKFIHSVFTALVALPTLLTVFTICASVEIAARLRGGKGMFGWLKALPWNNPIMLATAFSFLMLGFGGAGGLINMSYQLDTSIHNTQWVTGHFHLIFGGAIVIMYFAIAYDLWPHLTGRALPDLGMMRLQLWLWFVGMIVTTFPWHWVGILGMPRRMAFYDYTDPAIAAEAFSVTLSAAGGVILVISGLLFIVVLIRGQAGARVEAGVYRFAAAVHPPTTLPAALNGHGLWVALMVALTITNYGYPIAQLVVRSDTSVPPVYVGTAP